MDAASEALESYRLLPPIESGCAMVLRPEIYAYKYPIASVNMSDGPYL